MADDWEAYVVDREPIVCVCVVCVCVSLVTVLFAVVSLVFFLKRERGGRTDTPHCPAATHRVTCPVCADAVKLRPVLDAHLLPQVYLRALKTQAARES